MEKTLLKIAATISFLAAILNLYWLGGAASADVATLSEANKFGIAFGALITSSTIDFAICFALGALCIAKVKDMS